MAVYSGNLYVGCLSTATAGTGQALLRRRTPGGTWSTTDSGAANDDGNYANLIVYGSNLYAVRCTIQSGGSELIRTYNGTSWSTDQDVWTLTANNRSQGGQFRIFGSDLYYLSRVVGGTTGSETLLRTAGSWSLF